MPITRELGKREGMPMDLFFTSAAKPKEKKPSPDWTAMRKKDEQKRIKRRWNARSIEYDPKAV